MGDVAARTLANGLKLSKLVVLDLRNTGLKAPGIVAIAQSASTSQTLEELYLGKNEIGDEGVRV